MTIRVLLADDHPLVRDGLKAALATLPDVEVVAEAATGSAAIREALLHRPDVVVMDLQMPERNGVEATRELARAISAVAAGEAIFGPGVATRVLAYFAAPPRAVSPFPELTAREREVLDLLAAGHNNPADRPAADPERQDGRQPPVGDLRQAAGGRPHPGHLACPRCRPRPPLTLPRGLRITASEPASR